ncbi:MAG: oxidoreductase [Gammaproteobacteria bacterium]|nr:oxidoreductase [Gammaproteobacteria bacterium]
MKETVTLISGGAGRIGSAFCRSIVENDGKVVIGDISEERGMALQDELGSKNAYFVSLDTTDSNSIVESIKLAKSKYGKIDSAVHSAYPISKGWGAKFEDIRPENLKEDLFAQLGGAILFSQQIIDFFKSQGYGSLVHISSIQGVYSPKFEHYSGTNMVSPIEYAAIKSGIISITKYLSKYCGRDNIRINSISPGGIEDNQPRSFVSKYNESCNTKGMLDAKDLCGTLLFLLSEDSTFIHGQNIIVDDGWGL